MCFYRVLEWTREHAVQDLSGGQGVNAQGRFFSRPQGSPRERLLTFVEEGEGLAAQEKLSLWSGGSIRLYIYTVPLS